MTSSRDRVVTDVLGYRCFTDAGTAFRKTRSAVPPAVAGVRKVDPLLFGRLNWKLGFLV